MPHCYVAGKWNRVFDAVRYEWHEAPWFVLLVIGISAFVGPIVIFGLWDRLVALF